MQGLGPKSYKEASMSDIYAPSETAAGGAGSEAAKDGEEEVATPADGAVRVPMAAAGSLRSLHARCDYMTETYLGQNVPMHLGGSGRPAKAAVMNASCANQRVRPTFNKMAGIQCWANAIFLFINIEAGGENEFYEGGACLNWNAQNRQTEFSSDIVRLIWHQTGIQAKLAEKKIKDAAKRREEMKQAAAKGAGAAAGGGGAGSSSSTEEAFVAAGPGLSDSEGDEAAAEERAAAGPGGRKKQRLIGGHASIAPSASSSAAAEAEEEGGEAGEKEDEGEEEEDEFIPPCTICICCRLADEPYVWCGPVTYVLHNPLKRPIRFVFRFKEFDKLKEQEQFQRLLATAKVHPGKPKP